MKGDFFLTACSALLLLIQVFALVLLCRRFRALERRLFPVGARLMKWGPRVGEKAPEFQIIRLDGEVATLGGIRARPQLVVFFSEHCKSCVKLSGALRTFRRYWKGELDLILIGFGPSRLFQKSIENLGLSGWPAAPGPSELLSAWNIQSTPYVVLVGADGKTIGKGMVNSLENLEIFADTYAMFPFQNMAPGSPKGSVRQSSPASI